MNSPLRTQALRAFDRGYDTSHQSAAGDQEGQAEIKRVKSGKETRRSRGSSLAKRHKLIRCAQGGRTTAQTVSVWLRQCPFARLDPQLPLLNFPRADS